MTKPHADCWAWVVARYREMSQLPETVRVLSFLPIVIELAASKYAPRLHPWLDEADLLLGPLPEPEGRYADHLRIMPLASGWTLVVFRGPDPHPTDPTSCGQPQLPPIEFCSSAAEFWPVLDRFVSHLESSNETPA